MHDTRLHLVRHLPRAYFAAAPTLPAAPLPDGTRNLGGLSTFAEPENLGRYVTAYEAHTSGGARTLTRTANTGAAARETAGESGSANTLSPAGQPTASSHISPPDMTGVSPELETAPADDTVTGRQGDNSPRAQQLHAARTIFGRHR